VSTDMPVVVQAALGGCRAGAGRVVPIADEEIVAEALAAWDAGAAAIRLRVWEQDGAPSGRAEHFAELIEGIRAAGCDAILNFCGEPLGAESPSAGGLGHLVLRPELASFDCSGGPLDDERLGRLRATAAAFADAGVAPELQCSDVADVRTALRLRDEGLLSDPLRFVFVLDGGGAGGPRLVERVTRLTAAIPPDAIWSATAKGLAQLHVNVVALITGGHLRTGLEDNPWLVEDVPATNEELVRRVVAIVDQLDRPLATPQEAREVLRLPGTASAVASDVAPPRRLVDLEPASG
jgi:3-keto-5-aminohexanoate cleavage enzyme